MALCFLDEDDNIYIKQILEANWQFNMEQDLKMLKADYIRREVAAILTEQTQLQLARGAVDKMIGQLFDMEIEKKEESK